MNTARMDEILSIMTPDEVRDALWFVDTWERAGNMGPTRPTSGGGG
jgi:hypothetical protein